MNNGQFAGSKSSGQSKAHTHESQTYFIPWNPIFASRVGRSRLQLWGDSETWLRELPGDCIALAVTSPPYWNVVDYGVDGQLGQTSYKHYLEQMLVVWKETTRVLIPNGKLAIVTPIMPIPKSQIGDQHTRHLKTSPQTSKRKF